VQQLMDGRMPGCPRLYFGLVDVRDLADLHLWAMNHPAAGERFTAATDESLWLVDVARILRGHMEILRSTCRDGNCRIGRCV
jgi:dihydroflavonol-4-reductase